MNGNYIGILMWACLFGLAMKKLGSDTTKNFMANTAEQFLPLCGGSSTWLPFGIMGLVFTNVSDNGLFHLYPVRAPVAAAGGHHAADGAGDQPVHHLYLPAPQPLPTGVPLPA